MTMIMLFGLVKLQNNILIIVERKVLKISLLIWIYIWYEHKYTCMFVIGCYKCML